MYHFSNNYQSIVSFLFVLSLISMVIILSLHYTHRICSMLFYYFSLNSKSRNLSLPNTHLTLIPSNHHTFLSIHVSFLTNNPSNSPFSTQFIHSPMQRVHRYFRNYMESCVKHRICFLRSSLNSQHIIHLFSTLQ